MFLNQGFKLSTHMNHSQTNQWIDSKSGSQSVLIEDLLHVYSQILFAQYFIANIKRQMQLSIMNEIKPG